MKKTILKILPVISISIFVFNLSSQGKELKNDVEYSFFIGSDVVEMETVMIINSTNIETYTYEGTRYRIGFESSGIFSAGLEYTQDMEDETTRDSGPRVRLSMENSYGGYITIGKPVYLRVGWTTWRATYTYVDYGYSGWERMSSDDYGIGFKMKVGPKITVYAEYTQRNASGSTFSGIFLRPEGAESVKLPFDMEMYAAGVTFSF